MDFAVGTIVRDIGYETLDTIAETYKKLRKLQDQQVENRLAAAGTLSPEAVPLSDFLKLTRLPIVVYYGDNFPVTPTTERGQDNWRVRLAMARLWVDAVNRHGGDARLVHLPELGIRGNTHFPMSDLNNVQIADLVSAFLAEKKLDR